MAEANIQNKNNLFQLSPEGKEFVQGELSRYENKYSAIIPCLYRCQKENQGWVSPACIRYLSQIMEIPEAHIWEVAKFYTMFNKEPVGRLHIQVCCNISCALNGGRELADHLCQTYSLNAGEVSSDGMLTISRVECLGSCGTAPMMQINESYHENLNPEKAEQIINELRAKYGS
ncbi:MAG: NAD(P)H-dependent oxidoreductase subunit E [Bdellovibrionales bacterium]|nr:NAD(P)H-dependent oxidoreductase subunit E [Bdellovibrionales bacterium]